MKRLWVILFILNLCFGQFSGKSFKLVRGKDFFTIAPDKKIIINEKEYVYKKIDYKNEKLMVWAYNPEKEKSGNNVINFKEIKRIKVYQSTIFSSMGYGVRNGAILGFLFGPSIYEALTGDNPYDDTFHDQKLIVHNVFAYWGSLIGLPIGLFYGIITDKWLLFVIAEDKWMISK